MSSLTKGYVTMSDIQYYEFPWSDDDICDYFDTHPNILISELARMAGHSTDYIKRTLYGDDWND
jgi:hypothetical protein